MYLIVKRDWKVPSGIDKNKEEIIPIGRHEVERIVNPYGYPNYWIVLKGTLIGATEGSWRQWEGKEWEDFEVIIEDDYPIARLTYLLKEQRRLNVENKTKTSGMV